jgi:hypothetical protein
MHRGTNAGVAQVAYGGVSPNCVTRPESPRTPSATPGTGTTYGDKIRLPNIKSRRSRTIKKPSSPFHIQTKGSPSQLEAPRWSLQGDPIRTLRFPLQDLSPLKQRGIGWGLLCGAQLPSRSAIDDGVRPHRPVFRSPDSHDDDTDINVP